MKMIHFHIIGPRLELAGVTHGRKPKAD